jgi:hypothetical protein
MQNWYRWIALVVLIIPSLFSCPSATYSGRYEHFSLALRRDEIDGQIRQPQAKPAYPLALFTNFKCIFSVQIWCRWIALVVLVILSYVSCLSDPYSGRYEHLSLALRRDENSFYQLIQIIPCSSAIFKNFKCFLSVQVWHRWKALVVLVILN